MLSLLAGPAQTELILACIMREKFASLAFVLLVSAAKAHMFQQVKEAICSEECCQNLKLIFSAAPRLVELCTCLTSARMGPNSSI
jgi:hypothetical protein